MKIPQLVERKFLRSPDQPVTASLYEIIVAQNGVFKRAKRREMTVSIELSAFATLIPELAPAKAGVELIRNIPARIFTEILAHARHVTDRASFTENLYAVYWNDSIEEYAWQEISRRRSFGSTIADEENPAYQNAILEIHTHPPGCRHFSAADNADESGKFRLFGILVDIHAPTPSIRLRIGLYDSFWEIPAEMVVDEPLENITDLLQLEDQSEQMIPDFEEGSFEVIYFEGPPGSLSQTYLENL